jgi:dTDP-4-dehydrorhamnose reductase
VQLLVVGASGYTGGEICRQARAAGWPVVGTYHRAAGPDSEIDWRPLDARDTAAVVALVGEVRPTVMINTASVYEDWAVTADGAASVALAARQVGARLVHMSSDAVHAGRPEPYPDGAPPTPIFPYGAAKAAAETAVRAIDPGAALVRTSLIVGDERSKHVRLCLDMISGTATGALFTDEVRCPVAVQDVASAALDLAAGDFAGIINVAGPDAVSRAELGVLVARRYGLDPGRVPRSTIAESGLTRPGRVVLDSALAAGTLKTRLRGVVELFD